jgi:hypothetical protein
VILNSVTLHPTSVEVEEIEIAESERMENGTLRKWHRAYKNKWTLTWDGLHQDNIAGIRTLFRTTGVIVFNDEENTSFNVMTMEFNHTLSATKESRNGVFYYDIELILEEQ